MSPRNPPHFAGADEWFEQRGYIRKGRFPLWVKNVTADIQLRFEASASFYGEHNPKTALGQWVRLPKMATLDKALYKGSFAAPTGNEAGLVLGPAENSVFGSRKIPLELTGVGPCWDAAVERLGPAIEAMETQLCDHQSDLRPVLEGPYFKPWFYPYAPLLIILHAGDRDAAHQWLKDFDYETALTNPHVPEPDPEELTPRQQYVQACALVDSYFNGK